MVVNLIEFIIVDKLVVVVIDKIAEKLEVKELDSQ